MALLDWLGSSLRPPSSQDAGLGKLIARARATLARWCRRRQLSEHERARARNPCVPIDRPEFIRPDPLIYAQYYLMRQGLAVTWDNPDIAILRGGKPVASSRLEPGVQYTLVARIWNNSTSCPVIALPVRFSYLDFGMGGAPVPIGTAATDLGVKGGPNHPAFASTSWVTPARAGHYCVQVELLPPDDLNWENNLGQRNFDVQLTHSPAEFTFALRNTTERRHRYRFAFDGYAPGVPPPCRELRTRPEEATRARRALHAAGAHPLADGWRVEITPATPELDPGETVRVAVRAEGPPGFHGAQPINVHAYYDNTLAGGVTLTVVTE